MQVLLVVQHIATQHDSYVHTSHFLLPTRSPTTNTLNAASTLLPPIKRKATISSSRPLKPEPTITTIRTLAVNGACLSQMAYQAILTLLMAAMAFGEREEAVALDDLVYTGGEEGGGHVDEDGDGGVAVEGVAAPEDGGHDAGSEVASEVRGDGYVGEAPDHVGVGHADYERSGGRGYKGVGGIKDGPDYYALSWLVSFDFILDGGVLNNYDEHGWAYGWLGGRKDVR